MHSACSVCCSISYKICHLFCREGSKKFRKQISSKLCLVLYLCNFNWAFLSNTCQYLTINETKSTKKVRLWIEIQICQIYSFHFIPITVPIITQALSKIISTSINAAQKCTFAVRRHNSYWIPFHFEQNKDIDKLLVLISNCFTLCLPKIHLETVVIMLL